jgi:hypothetical protein
MRQQGGRIIRRSFSSVAVMQPRAPEPSGCRAQRLVAAESGAWGNRLVK